MDAGLFAQLALDGVEFVAVANRHIGQFRMVGVRAIADEGQRVLVFRIVAEGSFMPRTFV